MASKVEVSNNSPAVLDASKSSLIYKQKKLHTYDIRRLLKEIDGFRNGNDIALENVYYNEVSDDTFENGWLKKPSLRVGIGYIYNDFLKKDSSSSKIKTRKVKNHRTNFRNSNRLFSSKKLPLNYCRRNAFSIKNKFKRNNQHSISAEISAIRLRKELRHNKLFHLGNFFSSSDYVLNKTPFDTKPLKYQKTAEGNFKTHVIKNEKTDITRNRNVRSGKFFTPNKFHSFGENKKDHIDVVSLSGNEQQFLSVFVLGLFGIILVIAVFVFWVKKIFFDLRASKTFELRPPYKRKIKKPTLVVIHKAFKQNTSSSFINSYLPHLINSREMESGEANSDASLFDPNIESNKSTPYFTPLERLEDGSNRFEFPLPSDPIASLLPKEEIILPISPKISSINQHSIASSCSENVKNAILESKDPSAPRIRRNSLYERRSCSPQHSKVTNLLSNRSLCKSQMDNCDHACNTSNFSNPLHSAISSLNLNSSPQTSPVPFETSTRQVCFNRQSCRSPKMYENYKVDVDGDKENTIPIGSEIYSPKLKSTDFVVFQQQSPRILEASPTLISTSLSFSPKRNDRSELLGSHFTAMKSSPLSSAGYKNGDYFKFPEVDCFSPDVKKMYSLTNRDEIGELQSFQTQCSRDNIKIINAVDCQARRARLKSISLDSEGAKLVEDNLGVPVEELIERAIPVTSAHDNPRMISIKDLPCKILEHAEHNRKNKNNLTISIGNENQKDFTNTQQKSDAPKTPTLLQTKQKAISLDSSDSKFSSSGLFVERQSGCELGASCDHRQLAVSMLQIASLSMPGTPKRQASLNKNPSHLNRFKLASPMTCGQQQHKGRYFNSIKVLTTSTPSTSTVDHNKSAERQGFILKLDSFNESTLDDADYDQEEITADEEDDDNFFLNFDEFAVVNEETTSSSSVNDTFRVTYANSKVGVYDSDDNKVSSGLAKKTSPDYLLGTSLQTQKCITALSLSNSNLKTLPEVMTLSDFSVGNRDCDARLDKGSLSVSSHTSLSAQKQNIVSGRSVRSSLLQRRGSNHSLTLNLHGSYGNLSKGLSTSNYSLGSNSQYNLSNSIYNLSQHQAGALKSGPTLFLKGNPTGVSAVVQNSNVTSGTPHGASSCSGNQSEKKNLLQRRGSNTSLTLNIHGSPSVNLNRFSSHSSLNITASQQQNVFKMQQYNQIKDTANLNSATTESSKRKKGLLERRGSNTSLSINLQNNALVVSNINLQGSACSLSSFNTTQLEEDYESRDNPEASYGLNIKTDKNLSTVGQHRKFFSSENLNSLNGMTQYSKLNQAHMRSSTKTCFGSVSDLKPYCQLPLSLIIGEDQKTLFNAPYLQCKNDSLINKSCYNSQISRETILNNSNFQQSNLCSCTGVRNITTRPLSPQTTSEDFKMYLANIQLLQNASNVLNEYDLIKLNTMFDKIYGNEDEDTDVTEENNFKLILRSDVQFEMPTEDEQKQLLRNLHQEFWDLPTNHQEKPMVFGSQTKNRYKSILPNEHSRVQLAPEEGEIDTPYINANYIKGPDFVQKRYIATQGPLANTIYDFWVMVHQNVRRHAEIMCSHSNMKNLQSTTDSLPTPQSSSFASKLIRPQQKIIMLTNFVENNRQKCATYFPIDENEIFLVTFSNDRINNPDINFFYNRYFNNLNEKSSLFNIETFRIEINDRNVIDHLPDVNFFIIKNTGIIMKNGFSIRQLLCLFCSNINTVKTCDETSEENSDLSVKRSQVLHKFIAYHYWYPDWPDHRSPSDINVLLEISQHLLALGKCEAEFYYEFDGRPEENFPFTENSNEQPLPIIHCSAGIGRTGCMAAILNAICQITTSVSLNETDPINRSFNHMTDEKSFKTKNEPILMDRSVTYVPNNSDEDNLQSYPSQSFPYSKIVKDSHKLLQNYSKTQRDEKNEQIVKFREDFRHDGSNKSYFQAINHVPSIYVDILGIVCNLRLQRGGMVQNSEQYELIHRAMCLYLKKILKHNIRQENLDYTRK